MRSPKPLLITALLAAIVVGCSHTTTAGTPQPAHFTSTPTTAANPSALDAGKYPTTVLPPLGDAGTEQAGRLVEGRRMAAYVVGPWQADPTLAVAGSDTPASVIEDFGQFDRVTWPPIAGGAHGLPFVVGFMSERQTAGTEPQSSLRNVVLRFIDPASASAAAHNMTAVARNMPRDPRATPIVTAPEQAIPIAGHSDSAATLLTFQEGAQAVRELSVFTAHGPYVLIQVARCSAGPDCEAALAARTLDLQLPLIDSFTPTAGPFAALPLDPTGLLARTLPLPPSQATATSGATYPLAGAMHLESNPVQANPILSAAGVDDVAVSLTTVYQAKDPAAAQTLTQAYSDATAKLPGAQASSPVSGLPQSRCINVAGAGGLVPRYWCFAGAGRYAIKAMARQLQNAHQQVAAQYRILTA